VDWVLGLYWFAATGLTIYGVNYLIMVWLYWRTRREKNPLPALNETPRVTVQLPIFNELYVIERLIDATAALDWQHERLQIQVLDDSDDETTALAQARVDYYKRRGMDIALIRRPNRAGFKAGALAAGLSRASGDFIAIFDADFVPPRDFLKRTIPYFAAQPALGFVQTRWGHLNANYSALTRGQAIALDGHFVVEQNARSRNGLFMNFNGAGGVWRRTTIEQVGGWQSDTLTEDLDLSYRAQIGGWKSLFLTDVVSPAEIPPQIQAFKRQQYRWAKGSTQCLMKLAPQIIRAPNASLFKRVEGLLHLSGYLMNPLMLLLLVTLVPLIALNAKFSETMTYFSFAMFGPVIVYALSQSALYPDWLARFRYFGVLLLLGTGLSLNNSLAVFSAFARQNNTFRRTPKFRVERDTDLWNGKRYTLPVGWEVVGELALAVYALGGVMMAWRHQAIWAVLFLLLYAAGFGFTSTLSLWHSYHARPREIELAAAAN
jgi:cellulose synthase/poly-beta-1,6-N-acetylglucosamine synthase-like glycosyltransferase